MTGSFYAFVEKGVCYCFIFCTKGDKNAVAPGGTVPFWVSGVVDQCREVCEETQLGGGALAKGGAEPGVCASVLRGQARDQGERVGAGLALQFV